MNLNTMTTDERERLAYAEGFVETAKLFARLDDMHQALATVVQLEEERDEALARVEGRQDEVDALEQAYREKTNECDSLFEDYQTMRAERDELHTAVKLAIGLLENPDAGADEATAVLKHLRSVTW